MDAEAGTSGVGPQAIQQNFATRFGLALDPLEAERIAAAIRPHLEQLRHVKEVAVSDVEPATEFRAAYANTDEAP